MRYPIKLVPQGVIPRDPNLTFRAERVAQETPAAVGEPTMPFMGASAWSDVAQTFLASSGGPVEFNVELYDTDAIHDNATNPHFFTVPADGAAKWAGFARFGITATSADDVVTLLWRVNENFDVITQEVALVTGVLQYVHFAFPPMTLNAGDTVELIVQNNEDVTIGSAFSGDNPAAPYGPPNSDSAAAVVWRVGV